MKAGINRVVLEEISIEAQSKIALPDHLKEKKYKVLSVGQLRTAQGTTTHGIVEVGNIVHIVPNSAHAVKESGQNYFVCSVDDILAIV